MFNICVNDASTLLMIADVLALIVARLMIALVALALTKLLEDSQNCLFLDWRDYLTNRELNWMIGGPQGSGVDTAANIFGRACGYGGYNIFGKREYHSNIKGLHSYFHLRISESTVGANVNDINILAAFDAETVVRHVHDVVSNGGVILEREDLRTRFSEIKTLPGEFLIDLKRYLEDRGIGETVGDLMENAQERSVHVYPVPFLELLKEVADELAIEKLSRMTRMKNVLAIGISFSLLNYNVDLIEKAIRAVFQEKHEIVDLNVRAFRKAYSYAKQTFGDGFGCKLETLELQGERIFLSGYQAAALGKILGGCRMQTYYPITPAADESEYLEAHEVFALKKGNGAVLIIQAEDEIAAINMASGAALTGVRAATATSGPGFSLMVEGLSWAGNNEVPIVITYYQRGAPSTGLPTRHGQDDLRFTIHAGHGEFPRIVLASGDMKECFFDAANAFNYAEKYQMPVIHLIDKALANSTQSFPFFDLSNLRIERGSIVSSSAVQQDEYKRFKFTDSGVSPRAFLGTKGTTMWYTGDEHDETGHISEEPSNRNLMMEKRMKKLKTVNKEIPLEERLSFFGQADAENVVVSWGSPKGAILEAMRMLQTEGFEIEFMQARMINPLPTERIKEALKQAKTKISVEMNYSGQLADIVTEKTGIFMDYYILKYNGRPMTTTELHSALREVLSGKAPKRQVLNFGA